MYPKLEDCIDVTGEQYCSLVNPEFIGQTKVNSAGTYCMIWKVGDIFYKTTNCL